jgi:hypothetical protein
MEGGGRHNRQRHAADPGLTCEAIGPAAMFAQGAVGQRV